MSVGSMSCSSRPYKGGAFTQSLLYILLLLQMSQKGISAVQITIDVRHCKQHLPVRYHSDPLATWPCSNLAKALDAAKTAVIIVDMWDFHHCPSEHLNAVFVAAALKLACL